MSQLPVELQKHVEKVNRMLMKDHTQLATSGDVAQLPHQPT
jgi:hypothetical protein